MTDRQRAMGMLCLGVLIVIGCGGSTPQEASATTERIAESPAPMQLAQAPAEPQPAAGGGSATIEGVVQFDGAAQEPVRVKMDADPVCAQQQTEPSFSEAVVVNDNGTLQHVFVYVKEGVPVPYPAPETPVVLEQVGCWYQPHVFGLQANQPLEIVNSDATLHNINAKPALNRPFNIAQPVKGMTTTKRFTKPEIMVSFKCNVHPWMQAYAGVLDHPFFSVTGTDGAFAITGVPAGTYTLEAWHETYGTQTQSVVVEDGATHAVAFTFAGQ